MARPPGFRFREGARRTPRSHSPERAAEASALLPAGRTGLAQQTPPRRLLFTPCGSVGKAAERERSGAGEGPGGTGPNRAGPRWGGAGPGREWRGRARKGEVRRLGAGLRVAEFLNTWKSRVCGPSGRAFRGGSLPCIKLGEVATSTRQGQGKRCG